MRHPDVPAMPINDLSQRAVKRPRLLHTMECPRFLPEPKNPGPGSDPDWSENQISMRTCIGIRLWSWSGRPVLKIHPETHLSFAVFGYPIFCSHQRNYLLSFHNRVYAHWQSDKNFIHSHIETEKQNAHRARSGPIELSSHVGHPSLMRRLHESDVCRLATHSTSFRHQTPMGTSTHGLVFLVITKISCSAFRYLRWHLFHQLRPTVLPLNLSPESRVCPSPTMTRISSL